MYHGLTNQFLYSAYKIKVTFVDDIGNQKVGIGTCFFVMNKKNVLCMVTNRHVLDISYKQADKSLLGFVIRKIDISGKQAYTGDNFPENDLFFSIIPDVKFSTDVNNDIGCITNIIPLNGANIKIDYFIPYSFLAKPVDFQEKLEVCDFLAFPGFPEWHDKRENRPILRTGTISSDPRFDYSFGDEICGACVAYEAFSYSGSSGSPIFAVQKGPRPGPGINFPGFRDLMMVGINAGHLKTSNNFHSGISYFYKSTAIIDIIDS